MKIALTHMRHRATGGTERYLDQTARHLASVDHEVTVVCRSHEAPPHPSIRFVELRGPAIGSAQRMWKFARDVERHLASSEYDVVYGLGRTWRQDALRLGGGLVETYLEHVGRRSDGVLRRLGRLVSRKDRLAIDIERRALAAAGLRRLVVNSDFVRRDVLERYPAWRGREDRIEVVHNAADTSRFDRERWVEEAAALRRSFGGGTDALLYLYLGTGYRRKGLDVLLRAFARHAAGHPGARLAVVGRDSNPSHYENLAADLEIADRVHFAGGRRDPEVCFAASDVYVLPTRYDPFAAATVEALSSGLPVITTTTNGGCERVEEGETGSIVPPDDVASLRAALDAWSNPDVVEAARTRARAEALRFDEEAAMRTVTALLEDLASTGV